MTERLERPKDDRDLERIARLKPADHEHTSSSVIREAERVILGPLWGKKRRKMEGWPR